MVDRPCDFLRSNDDAFKELTTPSPFDSGSELVFSPPDLLSRYEGDSSLRSEISFPDADALASNWRFSATVGSRAIFDPSGESVFEEVFDMSSR